MWWLVILSGILGLALVLQAGLVAFAGYVALGSYLFSRWLARRWIDDVAVERQCSTQSVEVADTVEVHLAIRHSGRWPILWVLVEDLLAEEYLQQRPAALQIKGERLQVLSLRPGQQHLWRYRVVFMRRGYYPLGPTLVESGDVFGLHRRFRVVGQPTYMLVLPRMLPLQRYDFISQRPIGEIRLHQRLFEDPTRTAAVREYQRGDPLSRVHWKVTARTGQLHCRVYESTSLAGATLLLDFDHKDYPSRSEPYRSDLAITTAASIAYALALLKQPLGLVSNGCDAAARIRAETAPILTEGTHEAVQQDREQLHKLLGVGPMPPHLAPVEVPTRRGIDQLSQIRETLARLELNNGLSFAELTTIIAPRLPREATVIAIVPQVSVASAVALGRLRRLGFAVSVLLIMPEQTHTWEALGRLTAQKIHDVRLIRSEDDIIYGGQPLGVESGPSPYALDIALS
jgi:uncharacterized protein (DUF58 family)